MSQILARYEGQGEWNSERAGAVKVNLDKTTICLLCLYCEILGSLPWLRSWDLFGESSCCWSSSIWKYSASSFSLSASWVIGFLFLSFMDLYFSIWMNEILFLDPEIIIVLWVIFWILNVQLWENRTYHIISSIIWPT